MLDTSFDAEILKSPNRGGWTYVIWPKAAQYFGTQGAVKVKATVDGQPFQSSFMAMGGGVQMLPLKADLLKTIKKSVGDSVTIHLVERL